jgi:outer membrane protein OmpA-like peptidoglycan-associated protein
MNTRTKQSLVQTLAVGAVIVGLAGCASTPQDSLLMTQAREAVNQAESDPNVSKYAPTDLQHAREFLSIAQATAKKKGMKDPVTEHNAYSATLAAHIAEQRAHEQVASARIKSGETERQQILLAARENEADRAVMQARDAKSAAEQARSEAQNAQADAQKSQADAQKSQTDAQNAQAQMAQAQEESRRLASELQAAQTTRGLVLTLGDVLFDTGKSELKPGAQRTIDKLTSFLNENPERKVQVEGFTDSQGTDDYNLQLSQRRADAVASAITRRGIESQRVQARGYGEEYPVAGNDNIGSRQRNRRVEVVISNGNAPIPERGPSSQ